jgi:hypothetical protein
MIFEFQRDATMRDPYLAYLAFGAGHPEQTWRPSIYRVAHQRLHSDE